MAPSAVAGTRPGSWPAAIHTPGARPLAGKSPTGPVDRASSTRNRAGRASRSEGDRGRAASHASEIVAERAPVIDVREERMRPRRRARQGRYLAACARWSTWRIDEPERRDGLRWIAG